MLAAAAALAALALHTGAREAVAAPTADVSPGEVQIGQTTTVAGTTGAPPAPGAAATLEAAPYPYRTWQARATVPLAADGSFTFGAVAADRDTRLRVSSTGGASAAVQLTVDPRVRLSSRVLGAGSTRLSLAIAHARIAGAEPVTAWWYAQAPGDTAYRLIAVTAAGDRGGALSADAVVEPPARRFRWRVCVNPSWEAAMGPAASHGRCPRSDFVLPRAHTAAGGRARARAALQYGAEGRGIPLPPIPSTGAIASAEGWLWARAGRTSMAVINSAGRMYGANVHEHFESASVVKVMFLAAYLQMLAAEHRGISAGDDALLHPMIEVSDNEAASAVLDRVGLGAVAHIAREVGMTDYAPGVGWWAYTQTSAADQAKLLYALPRVIPARFYGYARYLMSTIEPSQSWGVPEVARPGWQVFFKTGQLPERGLADEAARLERHGRVFAVAVFTDDDPSMEYGHATIAGVGAELLAGTP